MPNPRLNEVILALYQGCCERNVPEFKEWAMETVRPLVNFDSGLWVTSDVVSDEFNSAYLFKQPPEMMENYHRTLRISGDFLAQAVVSNIGRTINSTDIMPYQEFIKHPNYLNHCRYYGMEYGLSTGHIHPVNGISTAIAFFRSTPGAPFPESARQTTEFLVPHMVEAMRINLFSSLHGLGAQGRSAFAICDPAGLLYETTQAFCEVMRNAWPDWKGSRVTLPFNSLAGQGTVRWVKNGFKFEASPCRDLFLLSVTQEDLLDRLTRRQTEVAQMLVDGKKYKSIARELAITPSTVTKHVNEIHARLSIDSREALISLFRQRQSATPR